MARMKKFTPSQKDYVNEVTRERNTARGELIEARRERNGLGKQLQETVENAVKAQADLDAELTRCKKLHADLLHAVEDYLEAENSKLLADRRYEGAVGRLGDLHGDHGQQTQEPNVMGFAPDPKGTFGWRRTR